MNRERLPSLMRCLLSLAMFLPACQLVLGDFEVLDPIEQCPLTCNGEFLLGCRNGQKILIETCPTAEQCNPELGICTECEPDELRCNGSMRELCAPDRISLRPARGLRRPGVQRHALWSLHAERGRVRHSVRRREVDRALAVERARDLRAGRQVHRDRRLRQHGALQTGRGAVHVAAGPGTGLPTAAVHAGGARLRRSKPFALSERR